MLDYSQIRVLAVDADGVLWSDVWPQIGTPYVFMIAALKAVRQSGRKLILNTCREGELLADALAALEPLGLTFDAVNENLPERIARYGGDCRKISADLHIDDRAIGFSELLVLETLWELAETPLKGE